MRPWDVIWARRAANELRRLGERDPEQARQIGQAVTRLAEEQRGDLNKLDGEWRLRVGAWRVRFVFDHATHTIRVTRVLRRPSAYRD